MNTKDLIEAAKFQASVKPQDEFMAEVAEGLETLYTANLKVCSDYDAACDELKKWQKLQPIGCPVCHRGCFSNDKFCPHCGTSLRNNNATTEKTSATEMADNEIIKAFTICESTTLGCADCSYFLQREEGNCLPNLMHDILDLIKRKDEQIEALIAGQETLQKSLAEKIAEIERKDKKIEELSEILSDTIRIRYAEARAEAVKELIEKLTDVYAHCNLNSTISIDILFCDIKRIAKEMVGEG